MALTDPTIRNAKPREKAYKLADGKGLYLLVNPTGSKWWRFKYRWAGREKLLSLGTYPDVSLKAARDKRDDARKLLDAKVDPSQHRKAEKAAQLHRAGNSFEVVAREWYQKHSPDWAPAHATRVIRRFERDVFPWIGGMPVGDIAASDLLPVVRRIDGRGARETAHRTLQSIGQVCRYAIATQRATHDPTGDLRGAIPSVKGGHFAAVTEPDEVGPLLRAFDGYEGTFVVKCALRLAPLVFVRPGELRRAEWAHIDLEAGEWRYTVSKTDTDHIVPLSKQAVAILRELKPLTGNGRYVFPSPRTNKRPISDNAVLSAMRRMGIEKDEMSGHGFRAMARTILDEVLGFRPDLIEHQLAHAVRDPNGRAYNRTAHLPERRKMMQKWADYLDSLKSDTNPLQVGSNC